MTKAMQRLEVVLRLMPDHGNLIRELVKQHTEEVIGVDEEMSGLEREEDFAISWINGEKAEQRKRAGLEND